MMRFVYNNYISFKSTVAVSVTAATTVFKKCNMQQRMKIYVQ